MNTFKTPLTTAITFIFCMFCVAEDQGITFEALLKNPTDKRVQSLPDLKRSEFVSRAREYYKECPPREKDRTRLLLIELGDEETINQTVRGSYSDLDDSTLSMSTRRSLYQSLKKSSQLRAIPHLQPYLMLDEPTTLTLIRGEFLIEAASVRAARLIQSILANSERVPAEVRSWAVSVGSAKDDELRTKIREFWAANKDQFAQKSYASIKPPQYKTED